MRQRSHLSRRFSWIPLAGLALLFIPASHARAQTYWFENYERAVALIDAGEMAEAATILEGVIKGHPLPVSCFKVPGDRCIDYIPYFHQIGRASCRERV